jgi:hypothetical protein
VRDESKLALDEFAFFETLPADLKDGPSRACTTTRSAMEEDYFNLFADLYSKYNDAKTRIPAFAVVGARAHGKVCRRDRRDGGGKTQIHMHTLQSPVQKAYGCAGTASRR